MTDESRRTADLVELHALCSRYMLLTSQFVQDRWLEVFTPDGEYNAFGTPYNLERFPALLEAAPRGQFIGNMPVVELDGDAATGKQHFVFIDQQTHAMRIGWYNDEYVRTGRRVADPPQVNDLHAQARRLRFGRSARSACRDEEMSP